MADSIASPWPSGGVLAVTKLHVPERRAGLVSREALVGLLVAGRGARLTLISAPPGSGKTTLLAEWHAAAAEERPFAWLSLDPDDADPVRFWACVVEAIRTVEPGFGAATLAALRSAHGRLLDVVVPLLINEAADLPEEVVLVLDDLHVIGDPAVHGSLAFLVDHLPACLRVAVATRTDPPLPLARWRARAELTEVRTPDLRFSSQEAAALLEAGFGLRLAGPQLERLQARTEGWAAGLQLAALSLRRGVDFESLISASGAGEHQVLDYLAGEVLDAQDPEVRRFLLETSVLERMSGPLCDAVTGERGSDLRLEDLARRNLLVVPLDGERRWWRYHHLFAELLCRELTRSDPAHVAELHRRAVAWHRDHGVPSEAIRHALAAGDAAVAAELVAEHWSTPFNRGELATVDGWLDALPARSIVQDERLWLARLWTAMDQGELVQARALLERAEREAIPAVRVWGPVLHALYAFKRGDVQVAAEQAARAFELDVDDLFWRTTACLVRGVASYAVGDTTTAAALFAEAADLAHDDGNGLGLAYALGYMALIDADADRARVAGAALERLDVLLAEDPAIGEHFVAFAGAVARARLAERQGAYASAVGALRRAADLAQRGAGRLELVLSLVRLGQVDWALGNREDARRSAREARRVLDECPSPGRVADVLKDLERRAVAERSTPTGRPDALSETELTVLRLLSTELSNREIGEQLFVSINTVKTHVRSIYAKLRAKSRDQAVGRAQELGILEVRVTPGARGGLSEHS